MANGDTRPLLAITQGDPAGIGPEVVLKALARHPGLYTRCRPLVVGGRRILARAAPWARAGDLELVPVADPGGGAYCPDRVDLIDLGDAYPADCSIGRESAAAGRAAVEAVFVACDLALAGDVDAVVTAPLNKAAMHLAGYSYAGDT